MSCSVVKAAILSTGASSRFKDSYQAIEASKPFDERVSSAVAAALASGYAA